TSTSSRMAISSPANGLIVYDSTLKAIFYHDGIGWKNLPNTSNTWTTNGNANTTPALNFIGTTDTARLIFRTNNVRSGLLDEGRKNVVFGSMAAMNMPDSSRWNVVI